MQLRAVHGKPLDAEGRGSAMEQEAQVQKGKWRHLLAMFGAREIVLTAREMPAITVVLLFWAWGPGDFYLRWLFDIFAPSRDWTSFYILPAATLAGFLTQFWVLARGMRQPWRDGLVLLAMLATFFGLHGLRALPDSSPFALDVTGAALIFLALLMLLPTIPFLHGAPYRRMELVHWARALLWAAGIYLLFLITLFLGTGAIASAVKELFIDKLDPVSFWRTFYSYAARFFHFLYHVIVLVLLPLAILSRLHRILQSFRDGTEESAGTAGRNWMLQAATWIILPLVFVYALILNVYGLVRLLTWNWPEGQVAWMVLSYVLCSMPLWLFFQPHEHRLPPLGHLFLRYWWISLIVPLAMLFIAAAMRIEAYGLTPKRGLLLLGGFWTGVIVILMARRGTALSSRLVISGAAVLLILAAIGGPMGLRDLSNRSQAARFQAMVQPVLREGLQAGTLPVWDSRTTSELRSIIDFLRDHRGLYWIEAIPEVAEALKRLPRGHGLSREKRLRVALQIRKQGEMVGNIDVKLKDKKGQKGEKKRIQLVRYESYRREAPVMGVEKPDVILLRVHAKAKHPKGIRRGAYRLRLTEEGRRLELYRHDTLLWRYDAVQLAGQLIECHKRRRWADTVFTAQKCMLVRIGSDWHLWIYRYKVKTCLSDDANHEKALKDELRWKPCGMVEFTAHMWKGGRQFR